MVTITILMLLEVPLIFFPLLNYIRVRKSMGYMQRVSGIITNIVSSSRTTYSGVSSGYTLTIEYNVDSFQYVKQIQTANPDYERGQLLDIYYNEKNPKYCRVGGDTYSMRKAKATLIFSLLMALLLLVLSVELITMGHVTII